MQRHPDGGLDFLLAVFQNVPNLMGFDNGVVARPHFQKMFVAIVQPVPDDAVFVGQFAGCHVRLNRACNARKRRLESNRLSFLTRLDEVGQSR